ncbi:uncharacterized protein [Battus philenor]|uniref:uncharacterized protein n=1 Tax=Battus philenor TaxID=42288 RepID=UPI0035CF81A9
MGSNPEFYWQEKMLALSARRLIIKLLNTKCVGVNIKNLEVPALVEVGAESIVLDCQYSIDAVSPRVGLVMKWFFNGSSGLVYQWIPPMRPQVVGLLKGKVDLDFKISDDPLQAYRAIKIRKPTTDLSGNYTCVVSTFLEEDRQTKSMLVYSPAHNFKFFQEKKYVFLVTLICSAEKLYPKPIMVIQSNGEPLTQALTEIKMDSWGLYTVTTTALVHDDDVAMPLEEFVCELSLPEANYFWNRTTIYYPGLMPTTYIATFEVNKPQERLSNSRSWMHKPRPAGHRSNTGALLTAKIILSYIRKIFNFNQSIGARTTTLTDVTEPLHQVRNIDLHSDLQLETVQEFFQACSKAYFAKASSHPNPLIANSTRYTLGTSFRNLVRRPKDVLTDPIAGFPQSTRHTSHHSAICFHRVVHAAVHT